MVGDREIFAAFRGKVGLTSPYLVTSSISPSQEIFIFPLSTAIMAMRQVKATNRSEKDEVHLLRLRRWIRVAKSTQGKG
jgi:hypothetical protein